MEEGKGGRKGRRQKGKRGRKGIRKDVCANGWKGKAGNRSLVYTPSGDARVRIHATVEQKCKKTNTNKLKQDEKLATLHSH